MPRPDYARVHSDALEIAAEDASASIPPIDVRITDLDAAALRSYRDSWTGRHASGYGGFDWVRIWNLYCLRDVRSFRCAVWHGSLLCGMAVGTVPRGHSHLTLRFIEARNQGHPLQGRIARIVTVAAVYYARGLQLPQLRIENPAPGLEAWYRQLGFGLAFQYLAMSLSYDQD